MKQSGVQQRIVMNNFFNQRDRFEKRLFKLKRYRKKIENMTSCHIVEHSFHDYTPGGCPLFYGDNDKICHGLDAAGDLSGGFKLIKEGLLKEVDFEISCIEKEIGL